MHKSHNWGSVPVTITDNLTFFDRLFVFVCLSAVMVFTFPHFAAASTNLPMVFEVDNLAVVQEAKAQTVTAQTQAVLYAPAPDPRADALRDYLLSKGSPAAPYADTLLRNYHYRFIIGIAFAESNFCKYNIRPYNCWGIGGGYPESYSDYPAAFERANQLIERYHQNGLTTPKLMRTTWVGWHNDNWIVAVEQVMAELEGLGL